MGAESASRRGELHIDLPFRNAGVPPDKGEDPGAADTHGTHLQGEKINDGKVDRGLCFSCSTVQAGLPMLEAHRAVSVGDTALQPVHGNAHNPSAPEICSARALDSLEGSLHGALETDPASEVF